MSALIHIDMSAHAAPSEAQIAAMASPGSPGAAVHVGDKKEEAAPLSVRDVLLNAGAY